MRCKLTRFHLHPFVANQAGNSLVLEVYSCVLENVAYEFSPSTEVEVSELVSRHHAVSSFFSARADCCNRLLEFYLSSSTTRAHPKRVLESTLYVHKWRPRHANVATRRRACDCYEIASVCTQVPAEGLSAI